MRRWLGGVSVLFFAAVACARRDVSDEVSGKVVESLTAAEISRILGFEGTIGSGGDWVPSGGTVSSSTLHVADGSHSLSMRGAYTISVVSTSLSALGSVGSTMSLQVWLPTALAGQSYKGQVQAFFNSNTLQLYNANTNAVSFSSLVPGQLSRIDIPLPSTISSKLSQSGYSDLKITLSFNLADIADQTFIDKLSFSAGTGGTGGSSSTGGAPATGGAISCNPPNCNDNNVCTTDTCNTSTGTCTHTPVPGTVCSDGNVCNGTDTCDSSGNCTIHVNPVVCTTPDSCHIAGVCNPSTGVCGNPTPNPGATCSDGDLCNGSDTCDSSGNCTVHSNPIVCTPLDDCHQAGTCVPATGTCTAGAPLDGTPCNDNNACTLSDSCVSGTCVGSNTKACSPADACHGAGACNPASGSCVYTFQAAGASCSDGNACNGAETCDGAGACVTAAPPPVDDANPCTRDACDPNTGVSHTPIAGGTACPGGKVCNGTGSCVENPTTMFVELPNGLTTSQVALGATSQLVLGDRDAIVAGASGIPYITNTGTTKTEIGAHATVGNTWGRGTVFLRSFSTVNGNVYTTTPVSTQAGAAINGTVYPSATFDPVERYAWTVGLLWGGSPFEAVEQSVDLPPGNYGDVSMWHGSVVTLSAGEYMADNFIVGSGATLVLPTSPLPVTFNIKGNFTVQGTVSTPTTPSVLPILNILGEGTAYIETPFNGVIFAPYGHVTIGAGTSPSFHGAIYGKEIQINPDVQFVQVPISLPVSSGTSTTPTTPVTGPRQLVDPLVNPLASCGPRGGLAVSAWPMQGFCPAQAGLTPFIGTRTNNEIWRYSASSSIGGQAVIGTHGELYVGTAQGNMIAVSHDGSALWRYAVGAAITSTAAVTVAGDVIFGTDDGHVFSLSSIGRLRWSTAVGDGSITAPVVNDDGSIYVGSSTGTIISLDKVGAIRWTSTAGSPVLGLALTSSNELYATTQSGTFIKLATTNGGTTWSLNLPAAAVSGPIAVAGGKLCVGTAAGSIVGVTTSGQVGWTTAINASIANRLAVGPTGLLLVPTTTGEVVAVSPDSHSVAWRATVGSGPVSAPIVGTDGVIYVGTQDGTALALQWPDGSTFWQASARAPVVGLSMGSDGLVFATTSDGQLIAIGTDPRKRIGHFANNGSRPECVSSNGLPWDPAVAGLIDCDGGTDPWSPIGVMTGPDFGSFGNPYGPRDQPAQENCSISLPSGATSCGLDGFCFTYDSSQGTGTLSLTPPGSVPAQCGLHFCVAQQDGTEAEVSYTLDRITLDPSTLPDRTSCPATSAQQYCPVDPDSKTDRPCSDDSECDQGNAEVCGVFCNDTTCTQPETVCGKRLTGQCSDLPAEPTGPRNNDDDSTWPCEELRECMETGVAGVTGDPQFKKVALLEVPAPPNGTTGMHLERVPFSYPSYVDTLNQSMCDPDSYAKDETSQYDPRSGNSGNTTWGVYAEPDIEHHADVTANAFGDPDFEVKAKAAFRAGAYVWGHDISAIDAQASVDLTPCHGDIVGNLYVFKIDYFSNADGDQFQPIDESLSEACDNAGATLRQKIADLKKALHDARLAWDLYKSQTQTQELYNRTKAVFGNVESGTVCTMASVQRWITEYENKANDLIAYMDGQYRDDRGQAQNALSKVIDLPPYERPFTGLGAAVSYPVGPIVVTMEVEVAGSLGVMASLDYSAIPVSADGSGPKANVVFSPSGQVNAFVYVGAGIPGVSVGVQGQLTLFGVNVPMYTGVNLGRSSYGDPRSYDSSGLFGFVANGPGLLGGGAMNRWTVNWTHGAGLELETLSGQVDLAVRIRLLFFKKTFRKKIADWKGISQTYNFVGHINSPLEGQKGFDLNYPNVPYPEGFELADAFAITPVPTVAPGNASDLGPRDFPGICGTPITCTVTTPGGACVQNADCCRSAGASCDHGVCTSPPLL